MVLVGRRDSRHQKPKITRETYSAEPQSKAVALSYGSCQQMRQSPLERKHTVVGLVGKSDGRYQIKILSQFTLTPPWNNNEL